MTKTSAALLLKALNWVAGIGSVVWIGYLGGVGLWFKTVLPLWFGDYSVSRVVWVEELMFGPPAVLWAIVWGVRFAVRRRLGMSGRARGRLDAGPFWTRPRYWVLAAFCLAWPALTEIPGLLNALGLDPERATRFPETVFGVIFLTPPLLLWAAIAAYERWRGRPM